ncbi:hypothetical protein [Acinetobacter rudis]|uniref:Uncharacterized protein n=1 Tax=Acinetobacter rudis CIP 110305 TaxID=421052 RepID=S3NJE1_9GAMM|nr:hypothetical protein [Acinetobacter rudis]EPF79762.1 hypothetical protein F945_00650 [Acinetobacter rudis CIP 110305]
MKKYFIVILFFILCISGCGKKYTITPDVLPVAQVNQEYRQLIHISGGKVVDRDAQLTTDIPAGLGITVEPENDLSRYNIIEIKGKPKYKGTFFIKIWAGFYAGGDSRIDKTYIFKVE